MTSDIFLAIPVVLIVTVVAVSGIVAIINYKPKELRMNDPKPTRDFPAVKLALEAAEAQLRVYKKLMGREKLKLDAPAFRDYIINHEPIYSNEVRDWYDKFLAFQASQEPSDSEMLDWMLRTHAKVIQPIDELEDYYVKYLSKGQFQYGPNSPSPRHAIAAAMKQDKWDGFGL